MEPLLGFLPFESLFEFPVDDVESGMQLATTFAAMSTSD